MRVDEVNWLATALCRDGEHEYAYSAPCPEHFEQAKARVIPPGSGDTEPGQS